MKTIAAREAKSNFGELLDTAQREPVTVTKKGRPVAVVVSAEEYKRMEAVEDAVWLAKAREAEAEGLLAPDESERILRSMLDAED
jgi:prevent-host-death family protein